jgi:CO dehydrogenase maturation factor
MSIKIAIAGKGGTGKTTISSLIIRNLIAKKNGSVLALDADPNSNLNELLGIDITSTVGQMVESFKKDGAKLSSGLYKDQMVEMNIHKSVIEGNGFDLLVMGRGEGPGCYCAANNLFKKYIEMLQESYKYIVMDNEAGMEHLSRKTTNNVDILLIVSDPSPRGILTAARLRDLAKELSINAKKAYLVLNRVDSLIDTRLLETIKKYDLEMIASINSDSDLTETELAGRNIFDLSPKSSALLQVNLLIEKLNL